MEGRFPMDVIGTYVGLGGILLGTGTVAIFATR